MASTQKLLSYEITLSGGGDPIKLSGLRSSCKIVTAGAPTAGGIMDAAIYGLPLSTMNQLTILGTEQANQVEKNYISITAGDSDGMSLVFAGWIFMAWCDAARMPDVCFRIHAYPGARPAVMKSDVTSINGSGDVATIAEQLAKTMDLHFENNNVQVKLSNPYLFGSYWSQMQSLAEHAGIQWIVDKGTLAIWQTGKSRKSTSGDAILLSKETGMVGYPSFTQSGIMVACLFNPALQMGGTIKVQSDLTPANGTWVIRNLTHDLESLTPHGRWFCDIQGFKASATEQPSGNQG